MGSPIVFLDTIVLLTAGGLLVLIVLLLKKQRQYSIQTPLPKPDVSLPDPKPDKPSKDTSPEAGEFTRIITSPPVESGSNTPPAPSAPPQNKSSADEETRSSPLDKSDVLNEIVTEARSATTSDTETAVNKILRDVFQDLHPRYESNDARGSKIFFRVHYPEVISTGTWSDLVVYMHTPAAFRVVSDDAKAKGLVHASAVDISRHEILLGTEIVVIPRLPECIANPSKIALQWMEDWHRLEFRVRANSGVVNDLIGSVCFYLGPLQIGEVFFAYRVSGERTEIPVQTKGSPAVAAYQTIFVSYAHEDTDIVQRLEKAYEALGMTYFRDIRVLRSGEQWQETLSSYIDKADLFQLCWSTNARDSSYVEKEWRYALGLNRERFIRPMYWKKPMPPAPTELSQLHFSHLDW